MEYSEPKRVHTGRRVFLLLSHVLIFAIGINFGKSITDRQYHLQQTLGNQVQEAVNNMESNNDEAAKEKFKKQISMEVERRLRNQIEEQVKAEMDTAFNGKPGEDGAEVEDSEATRPLAALPNLVLEEIPAKAPRVPASKKKTKVKREPDSVGASNFSIELSRYSSKPESEEAMKNLKARGLKVFRRK